MAERFVSEAIRPDAATFDTSRMAAGEPGLPAVFHWRKQTLRVARVVRAWRETGPCDHGSSEAYVRKHWYEVVTDAGQTLRIYFERQPRGGKDGRRWWLFTLEEPDGVPRGPAS
jgi:hypothetical protein